MEYIMPKVKTSILLLSLLSLFVIACQEQDENVSVSNQQNAPQAAQQSNDNNAATKANPMRGMQLAESHCSSCHNLDSTRSKVGPGLKGVYGQAPRIKDIPYAVWDNEALDAWLADPNKVKPRTRMGMRGIKNVEDRADIIAWMQQNN
ncbi:MAG: c-type cytochrome [Mariprofundales bacterium]